MAQFNSLADAFGMGLQQQQEPEPPQTTNFSNTPQLADELRNLRAAQQASLEEHQSFSQSRAQMQGQLQERSADLDAVSGFLQATDPSASRGRREFMARGWARQMGVDVRSESARELIKLVSSGLSPEEMTALRGSVVEASQSAQPGSMRRLFKAVGDGSVPASSLFQNVADYAQRNSQTTQAEVAQMAGAPRPQNYTVGPQAEELDPAWSSVLGDLQPGTRYRWEDAQSQFGLTIPRGEEGKKALTEFRTRQSDFLKLQGQINNLDGLVNGRPDALGPSGTISQWLDSVGSQIGNLNRRTLETNLTAQANRVIKEQGITDAQAAALVRSRFAELTFAYARVLNGPGVLSQADIEGAAQTIGQSWSAGQSSVVLRDVAQRSYAAYQEWGQRQVGKDVGLPMERLSIRQLGMLATSEATPPALGDAAHAEVARRRADLASRQPAQREENFQRESVTPQGRTDNRRQPTLEAEEEGFRRQADTERRQGQEDRSRRIRREGEADTRANTQLELAIEQFRRAAEWRKEDKAEKHQEKVQAAIQQLAKTLGGGSVPRIGGGGGGGGGDQNPGAFQLPPRRQRQAPSIPNVRGGK